MSTAVAVASPPKESKPKQVTLGKETTLSASQVKENDWKLSLSQNGRTNQTSARDLCSKGLIFEGSTRLTSPIQLKKAHGVSLWVWNANVVSVETGNEENIKAALFLRAGKLRCLHAHNAEGPSERSLLKALEGKK